VDGWIQHEWETPRVWDIYPLVDPIECDGMLQPIQIFGIGYHVVLGDRHDLPSGELLLAFALEGDASSEDCVDRLVGILESKSCILRMLLLLAVIGLVVLMCLPFLLFIAESFGHAIALLHGVLVVLVNWARTVKELFVGSIKIVLSAWLLYVVDEVFRSAVTWLCSPRSLWPIIMPAFAIIVIPIGIFIMTFFAAIIITMWVAI